MGNNVNSYKRLDVVLLSRIKRAIKKKTFWINRKRHGFRHKQKKIVFLDQGFKLKKRTRMKLERESAKPIGVQAVVYVKLLWRFITVKKCQFRKRPKLRKKHRKNRTCVGKKERQGKVFYKLWLISFCAKKKTEKKSYHLSQRKKKRKRRQKIADLKQQAWKRVLVVVVTVFGYGIHVKCEKLTGNSIISLGLMNDLGDRFVSGNTKIKIRGCKCLPKYLEKEVVKEFIQVAYFERCYQWLLSFGKGVAIAAETVSTKHIYGKTLKKVSLTTVSREKEARLTGAGFLDVYVTTFAGTSGKNNGFAWDDCSVDRQPWGTIMRVPMEVQGERQRREGIANIIDSTKLKLKCHLTEHTRSDYTKELNADTKFFSDLHLEDKVNFGRRGIDTSSDLVG